MRFEEVYDRWAEERLTQRGMRNGHERKVAWGGWVEVPGSNSAEQVSAVAKARAVLPIA